MRIELDGLPLSDFEVATIKRMRLEESDPNYNRPEWHFYHKGTLMIGQDFTWNCIKKLAMDIVSKSNLTQYEDLQVEKHIAEKLKDISEHVAHIESGLLRNENAKREIEDNRKFRMKALERNRLILEVEKKEQHMEIKLEEPWDQARKELYREPSHKIEGDIAFDQRSNKTIIPFQDTKLHFYNDEKNRMDDFYNRLTEIVGIPAHLQGKVGVYSKNPHIINKEPFGKEKK